MESGAATSTNCPIAASARAGASAPKLDRRAIENIVRSGKRLLVQGAMGIHASDGLAGKVAAMESPRLIGVGTISAVVKSEQLLRAEIRRARADAPSGFIGMNLMAAINRADFDSALRIAFEEGISFIVQGAGISRDVVKQCRDAGVPFAGIVSSGRLAKMYEKWGAEFLVAEGAEAGGHIGDIGHPLPALLADVLAHSSLPTIAAGGIDAEDLPAIFGAGAAGAQLATRFLACSEGDSHLNFKQMHLAKRDADVTLITSCVKGMKARAVRNTFTDALLAAAIKGDTENGLFYTGQSVTRIPEQSAQALPTVAEIFELFEDVLDAAESTAGIARAAGAARG